MKKYTINLNLKPDGEENPYYLEALIGYFSPLYWRVETGVGSRSLIAFIETDNIKKTLEVLCVMNDLNAIAYMDENSVGFVVPNPASDDEYSFSYESFKPITQTGGISVKFN